jgi:hypothetical protein
MRPPRNAADLLWTGQRRRTAEQLNQEPKKKVQNGRNLEKERIKENWKQNN